MKELPIGTKIKLPFTTLKVEEEDKEMLKSLGFFPSEDESGFYSFRFGSL